MSNKNKLNHLLHETSPYLLQHADNPVNWHAWNATSLEKARQENKIIFLSIGYSACHWCHVMAHESFEDMETAEIMNQYFINIKIDREERPDIDKIYQTAHTILTKKNGGWPLSMFLTPQDHIPFFGGTYFPKEAKYGLFSFQTILKRIVDYYQHHKDSIEKQNDSLVKILSTSNENNTVANKNALNASLFAIATQQLEENFDWQFGGFGTSQKFPHPSTLEYLLRQSSRNKDATEKTLDMVLLTLDTMAYSGLYDQLAGGFYRYSIDSQWIIPHFEKMLYDNALLIKLYGQAWQIIHDPLYKKISMETAQWIIDEMQNPMGGYYSSLDADSEGEEGKFYTWESNQIEKLLEPEEYKIFAKYYGLDQPANFENKWHLRVIEKDIDGDALALLEQAKKKVLQHRATRVTPSCDDKILTAWNALMIKSMATIGFIFNQQDYTDSAEKALGFIYENLYKDGKLLVTYRADKTHLNAYLDDYVFLIDAILALLQCRWDLKWLNFAIDLTEELLLSFADPVQGGFFFTSNTHEKLIYRGKYFMDDVIPCGNGVAAHVLSKLGYLISEQRYLDASEAVLNAAWTSMQQHPSAHNTLLNALDEYIQPVTNVIIVDQTQSSQAWQTEIKSTLTPYDSIIVLASDTSKLPGSLKEYKAEKSPVAYVCTQHACKKITI